MNFFSSARALLVAGLLSVHFISSVAPDGRERGFARPRGSVSLRASAVVMGGGGCYLLVFL